MAIPVTTRSVLIVDDNQDLAENIAEILSMRGYTTEIATSAEEALPKAIPDGPGILVTDYRLPGMSGADLVREIRQVRRGRTCRRDQRVHGRSDDLGRRSAGADFLPKPVDFASLSQLLAVV